MPSPRRVYKLLIKAMSTLTGQRREFVDIKEHPCFDNDKGVQLDVHVNVIYIHM